MEQFYLELPSTDRKNEIIEMRAENNEIGHQSTKPN